MNVLLLQLDGKLPSLPLMQLAASHRAIGDRVELRRIKGPMDMQPRLGDPVWDRVYASLIFEWTRPLAAVARRVYSNVMLGGTGWDFENGVQVRNTNLPTEAAAAAPDYADYPDFEASLGFTQRGCRFRCDFCVVPRKEGRVRSVATLRELWRGEPHPRRVVLLDNDFFGNPAWRDVIGEAREGDFALSVIQGINARTLNDEQAAAIASVRWMDDGFDRTRVYTAWDSRGDERVLFRGLRALERAGIAPDSMMVYMLVGHAPGETHADRDHRRAQLRAFGARPYPMPFVHDGELGDELRAFKSWVVQRHDLHVPWERWWGKAKGNPRKLGPRRVSLPLFGDG